MKSRAPLALLLPLVVLVSGCGGGGGDDDATPASPFAFSGTKTGTFDYLTGADDTVVASDVPVTGTIARDGTFRFTAKNFQGRDEVFSGKVDEFGTVSTASRSVTATVDNPSYTQNGRGSINRSGNSISFTLGFASGGNPDGPNYDDNQYVGTIE